MFCFLGARNMGTFLSLFFFFRIKVSHKSDSTSFILLGKQRHIPFQKQITVHLSAPPPNPPAPILKTLTVPYPWTPPGPAVAAAVGVAASRTRAGPRRASPIRTAPWRTGPAEAPLGRAGYNRQATGLLEDWGDAVSSVWHKAHAHSATPTLAARWETSTCSLQSGVSNPDDHFLNGAVGDSGEWL